MNNMIFLSSTFYPGEVNGVITVLINNKEYSYKTNKFIENKFQKIYKHSKFKSLNFLKKNSDLIN